MTLAVSLWALGSTIPMPPAAAAIAAGTAVIVVPRDGRANAGQPLASGGSSTEFALELPPGASCTGDSAGKNYRWQTYMVPASVDPARLTFDSSGPTPRRIGADFRQPLWDASGSPVVNKLTDQAVQPGGPGLIINIPATDLGIYEPASMPAGAYRIGVACTLGPPSPNQLDRFWTAELLISSDPADRPAGVKWTSQQVPTTSTTSTPATLAGTSGTGVTSAPLPRTGGNTVPLVAFSVLLVVFGQSAALVRRKRSARNA